MTRRQLILARIVFAVYILAVLVLCFGKFEGTEDVPMDLWGIPTDKVVHFLMFFPFPALAYLAFDRYKGNRSSSFLWAGVAFLAGCAYAAVTELIQSRLSYRSGDPVDFQADFLALAACSVFILIIILLKHKK
jgi:VanZ family protein